MDIIELQKVFSKQLYGLLNERDWNPSKFAREAGLCQRTVLHWLKCERAPQMDNLCKLADYFGCTVDYLLGREKY